MRGRLTMEMRAEHHARALRESLRGMRGEVMGPEVRLDFHDAPHALDARHDMHEVLPEELVGNDDRVAVVEAAREASLQSKSSHSMGATRREPRMRSRVVVSASMLLSKDPCVACVRPPAFVVGTSRLPTSMPRFETSQRDCQSRKCASSSF